jgi:hypothetical protein
MESLTACGKKRNCLRLGSKRIAPSVEHAVDLVVNLSAGFAALISIHWTTARVSASSSSNWPAAVRPTLPPPRRAVCSAMVWALWADNRETTSRSPESLERRDRDHIFRIALTTQSAQFAVRQASRFGLFERHFRNQNALTFVSLARG